jgi:hypothetical protein
MAITLDLTHLPIVLTKFDGEQTMADVEEYIARMGAVHERRQPYLGLTWMRRYARAADQTARIARWMKDTDAVTRECCAGAAMITQSAGFRFALAAIFLIKPMPCPYLVCGTWPEALKYVQAQARQWNVALPELACPWPELA